MFLIAVGIICIIAGLILCHFSLSFLIKLTKK